MNLEVHEHAMYVALTSNGERRRKLIKSLGGKSPRSPSNTYVHA